MQAKRKQWLKKQIREWGLLLSFVGILYFSGLHTEVIGGIQSLFLKSGLLKAKQLEQPVKIRSDAKFSDLKGNIIQLSDLRGKVILLNIWATWCPPCIAEMPDLQRLYDSFQDENLVYIFLSVDDNKEQVKEFLERKEFTLPIYFPASSLPREIESNTIPSTYVIDKQGRIVMKRKGMAKYNSRSFKAKVRTYLDE